MPLILGTNSIKDTGFDVANSLRFNSGSSDYLSKSASGSTSSNTTWTISFWTKRANLGAKQVIFMHENASGHAEKFELNFSTDNTFSIETYHDGYEYNVKSSALFRDVSAWYNFVIRVDTTQSTEANRYRVYVNGEQIALTETGSGYPSQNFEFNLGTKIIAIGRYQASSPSAYLDGYLTELVYCDGQSLDPTSFGEFDSATGIWKPIDVSGLTFGTNGFYLDFEDSSALGDDVSGNGNDFTVNNLTAIDQSTDTCTNNFATFNAAHPALANAGFSEGNLQFASDGSASTQNPASSSIAVSTGKWYAEFNVVAESSDSGSFSYVGVAGTATWLSAANNGYYIGNQADTIAFNGNQSVYAAGNEVDNSETNYANGNIVGVAADFTNSKIYFHVNGTYINSGDPAGASNGYDIPATAQSFYYFAVSTFGKNATWQANFGSPPYAISSGNTDGNGYGNFEYAVPSGYFALCTKNLAEYG